VINASVSGETTAGGLTRLPGVLAAHRPLLTIIEWAPTTACAPAFAVHRAQPGSHDSLVKKQGSEVLLVGMRLPPNYGPDYTRKFRRCSRRWRRPGKCAWCRSCCWHGGTA